MSRLVEAYTQTEEEAKDTSLLNESYLLSEIKKVNESEEFMMAAGQRGELAESEAELAAEDTLASVQKEIKDALDDNQRGIYRNLRTKERELLKAELAKV